MTPRVLSLAGLTVVLAPAPHLAADTHRFTPERFYNTYSFAHPPALRITPGDRVITTTLDASGVDAQGRQAGQRPNPQTGPFYVEGAEPGDLLVVTFEKLGSFTLEDSLNRLVREGLIERADALAHAVHPDEIAL